MAAGPQRPRDAASHFDYWLRRCEGFRVDSKDGRVGIVEEVRLSSSKQPEALAVRTGLFRLRLRIVPVHEVERTNSLGEPIFASPAISQGRIFIRGAQNLYCIGKKKGA